MKTTTKFKPLKLDEKAYKRALRAFFKQKIKEAVRVYLSATVLAIIPTWSGASRATFEKLAHDAGTSIPYGPQRSIKDRKPLGRNTSAGSGIHMNPATGKWSFSYKTQLRYLEYNEYNRATKGFPPQPFSDKVRFTPYGFQASGAAAVTSFMKKVKLPDPTKFMA